MKILGTHGDSSSKRKSPKISGHMYNPVTGTIDTFIDGEFSHVLCQLHEPQKPVKSPKYVVGTSTHLNLDYASGPSKWNNNQMAIIPPKKGK